MRPLENPDARRARKARRAREDARVATRALKAAKGSRGQAQAEARQERGKKLALMAAASAVVVAYDASIILQDPALEAAIDALREEL